MLILATVFSNFFNLAFNAFLGRNISLEDFALVSLIGSILSLVDIPIGALGRTVTHRSAFYFGKHNRPAKKFWQTVRKKALILSILVSVLWVIISPFTAHFFRLENLLPVLSFTPVLLLMIVASVDGGYLGGNMKWGLVASIVAVESVLKLSLAIGFSLLGLGQYSYVSILSSLLVSSFLFIIAAKHLNKGVKTKVKESTKFPAKFYFSSAISKISIIVYLSMDVILAKHFLPPVQAGEYALLSLAGKMVYFAGSLFSQFILPVLSHKEGTGINSNSTFYKLLTASFLSSMAAFVVIGALGSYTMPLIFGSKALTITPYLFMYSLSMVAFTVASNIASFHQLKDKHLLSVFTFLISLTQILAINLFHASIGQISLVMVCMGFLSLIVVGSLHYLEESLEIIFKNIRDFVEAFLPQRSRVTAKGMRVLIFNWRDTKHMWAGGAEMYVHEIARRWVKSGNTVTQFCGNDGVSKRNETVDGVNIVRRGGFYTVYLWAAIYYILKFRKNYDVIIDSENGIPFFAPLFSTKPVLLLIHHVHQDIFIEQMKFPFSYIGRYIEGKVMPFVYKNKTVITVSESSKKEIIKAGIAKEENIQIVNPGIDLPERKFAKSQTPTIIYLGRLKAYKNIDIAIRAFAQLVKRKAALRLWVVGDGEYMGTLKDLAIKLGLEKKIAFFGKVSEEEKIKLLSQSWVAVQPSTVEGWGITVLEANACKTPVVASDTNGLKDSVVNGVTGRLARVRETKSFAKELNFYLKNHKDRKVASQKAYKWAQKFSWDASSDQLFDAAKVATTTKTRLITLPRVDYLLNRVTSLF